MMNGIQILTVLCYLLALVALYRFRQLKISRELLFAPATFFIHVIAFYGVVILTDLPAQNHAAFTTWSAAIRLHGGIMAAAFAWVIFYEYKRMMGM